MAHNLTSVIGPSTGFYCWRFWWMRPDPCSRFAEWAPVDDVAGGW